MPSVEITFQNNADCDAKICWESPENSKHAARVFGEIKVGEKKGFNSLTVRYGCGRA